MKTRLFRHLSVRIPVVFILLMTPIGSHAQSTLEFSYGSYGLENDTINVIQNAAHLESFYQRLLELRRSGTGNVTVVHIGDSHIQGDYLTQPLRWNFQNDFGNAGRGLIVPGRVAGTNESYNIVSSTTDTWEAKRCSFPDQPLPIGVGGITISTHDPSASFEVRMRDPRADYSFNKVILFFQNDGRSYDFVVADTLGQELAVARASDYPDGHAPVMLNEKTSGIRIQLKKASDGQHHATIFGLSLENGESGVLYHSIGVNGAKYKHYNAATYFASQAGLLAPDLIIISLGTNEALDYPFPDRNLDSHIDELVSALRSYNPGAAFILSTPPPAFRRRDRANPGIGIVREQVISYAVENGFAFWDMFNVMGGDGHGPQQWRQMELLRPDGVHFTKAAYEYHANLLYAAILKGYNDYVLEHRP